MDTTGTDRNALVNRGILRERILDALKEKGVIWLSGPRGVGKTPLFKELGLAPNAACYIDCEHPVQRDRLAKRGDFLAEVAAQVLVLDEVHHLDNLQDLVQRWLENPERRIIAISSAVVSPPSWLVDKLIEHQFVTPLRLDEVQPTNEIFSRLLHRGGMPAAFLSEAYPSSYYSQWLDSFLVRDFLSQCECRILPQLQELLRRLFQGSGGIFKCDSLAKDIGVTPTPIKDWLLALETMRVITIVPHIDKKNKEKKEFRKMYTFDAGLVCHANGWEHLGPDTVELLWRHLVLSQLQAHDPRGRIAFFDEKDAHLDFVISRAVGTIVDAFDCRWDPRGYVSSAFDSFRARFPNGNNILICPQSGKNLVTPEGHIVRVRSPLDYRPLITYRVLHSEIKFARSPAKEQKHPNDQNLMAARQKSALWFKIWFVGQLAKIHTEFSGETKMPDGLELEQDIADPVIE